MKPKFIQLDNLPADIKAKEIAAFLDEIEITKGNIPGTDTQNGIAIINKKQNVLVLVKVAEKDIVRCIKDYDQKILRNYYPVYVSLLKEEPTLVINKFKKKVRFLKLVCEWTNCNLIYNDRSLYLSHINLHVRLILKEKNIKCKWQGCYDFNTFNEMDQFKVHLSFHAYHNQLMNIGQQIMDSTKPKPICYNDTSARNVVANFTSQLICGWNNCNGEFNDAETFFTHVDKHAIEDVDIPMMSKEKLKRVRYAKCQWINCNSVFKKKSHLKMHLSKHTQKKFIACPVCGTLFSTRNGFLKHCFRQETPTNIQSISTQNFGDNENDGILTIDENDNQSSIVIHLPHHILKSEATIINSNELQLAQKSDRSETESNVALLVNFDSSQRESDLANSNNDNELPANNVIQLQLTPAPTISETDSEPNIERQFRCSYCPKSFNLASLLCEHMVKHNKKFVCPHCSYSAPFQSRIDEHVLFRHNKFYEFKCHICNYPFKKRRFLDRHLELHNNNNKIVCQVCERTFTNYYSLNRHVRLQHLNEQIIFACHLCDKEYNRGNNLSRHLINCHLLKVADGWSRFNYAKQTDGIFRINTLSCTQ